MRKTRKRLIKKAKDKSRHVYAKCREDKHLWRKSKYQDELYTCRCCYSIKFV